MNSSRSLHRVALDLLIGARLSFTSNPNTFLEDSFPVVVVHPRPRSHRSRDCERTRSEDRSDKKEWALPQGRLTCAHLVLSNRVVLLSRCQLIGSCMVRG